MGRALLSVPAAALLVALPQLAATAYALLPPRCAPPSPPPGDAAAAAALTSDAANPASFLCRSRLPPMRPEWEPVMGWLAQLSSRVSQREARGWLLVAGG